MAYLVNELISEVFETGATGETFTTAASYKDGVPFVWAPTFSEVGMGFYLYVYTPDTAGSWSWSGTGSSSGPLTINFDVDTPSGEPTPEPTPTGDQSGTTLIELVEAVALRSLDLLQPTATTTTDVYSLIDTNTLIEDNAFFAGMEVYFKTGLNVGLTRRIANSDYTSGRISWEQPLPHIVTSSTQVDLFNRAG